MSRGKDKGAVGAVGAARATGATGATEGGGEVTLRLRADARGGGNFEHTFEGAEVIIGRASTCDLSLDDRFLSRQHTRLRLEEGRWLVDDLGSRNGTLLNGRPVTRASTFEPGDRMVLSGWTLTRLPAGGASGDGTTPPRLASSSLGGHTILRSASGLLSQGEADRRSLAPDDLQRYAERLELLNEVHRALGQSLEQGELLELILDRVFDHLEPEQGAIFLQHGERLEQAAARSRDGDSQVILFSSSLMREVAEQRNAALVLDVEQDERFQKAESILATNIRSIVAAPLLHPGGCLGMIALSSTLRGRRFTESDMELLVSLASVAALSLRNVALAEEAAERRRMEKELALGRRIQEALLPDRLPKVPGYDFYAVNRPSRGVSGDYYQVLERDGGREVVAMIADVSGKGIAASLLTASLEALAVGPLEDGRSPNEVFDRLSRRLRQRTPPEKYATAFLAVLEPASGRLVYANAGHNAGLFLEAGGGHRELESTGPPLGLLPAASYFEREVELESGDLVVLFTDGITEATNPEGEEFGEHRLLASCRACRERPLVEIVEQLKYDLDAFVRGEPYEDDRTLVLLRRS